jgi:hypothetical protein
LKGFTYKRSRGPPEKFRQADPAWGANFIGFKRAGRKTPCHPDSRPRIKSQKIDKIKKHCATKLHRKCKCTIDCAFALGNHRPYRRINLFEPNEKNFLMEGSGAERSACVRKISKNGGIPKKGNGSFRIHFVIFFGQKSIWHRDCFTTLI